MVGDLVRVSSLVISRYHIPTLVVLLNFLMVLGNYHCYYNLDMMKK